MEEDEAMTAEAVDAAVRAHEAERGGGQEGKGTKGDRTRWPALAAFCVAAALLSLHHAVTTRLGSMSSIV